MGWADGCSPWDLFRGAVRRARTFECAVKVFGDLNARTRSCNSEVHPHRSRASEDTGPVTKRGRELLQLGAEEGLVILNGTLGIPGEHAGFTSFQRSDGLSRRSVIDYVVASVQSLPFVSSLTVHPHDVSYGSDHTLLTLVCVLPGCRVPDGDTQALKRRRVYAGGCESQVELVEGDDDSKLVGALLRGLWEKDSTDSRSGASLGGGSSSSRSDPVKGSLRNLEFRSFRPCSSHRGRDFKRAVQKKITEKLEGASSSADAMWKLVKFMVYPPKTPSQVSLDALYGELARRMNPPDDDVMGFLPADREQDNASLDLIPERTSSVAAFPFLDEPVSEEDIEEAKQTLKGKVGHSAAGLDGVTYGAVLSLENEALCSVLNECFLRRVVPSPWLTTVVAGIPKPGKDATDPKSYRAIALESCLLKFCGVLINRKFCRAAEEGNLIPPSQAGFRPHFRTNDNVFILRTMVDKASAAKTSLYVAFVDISNAFPSTDHARLWCKMEGMGLTGRYFDWVRRLYSDLRYRVRQEGLLSPEFQSLLGVLAGDPLSPTLWDLFVADFRLPSSRDDLLLFATAITHLEFADDITLMSTTAEGLQKQIDALVEWCRRNFLVLNAAKTRVMLLHGPLPSPLPVLRMNGEPLEFVSEMKYLGVTITSVKKDMFHLHLERKCSRARSAGHTIFLLELMMGRGRVPPQLARCLYMALVDCHLVHGAEIMPDITKSRLEDLSAVQVQFLRKMVRMDGKCCVDPLYTETGLLPIRFRRLKMCLNYLEYLVPLPSSRLVKKALLEAQVLRTQGKPSWLSDLDYSIQMATHSSFTLPALGDLTVQGVQKLRKEILGFCIDEIHGRVQNSERLYLLRDRMEPSSEDKPKLVKLALRHYLTQVKIPDHRLALTRLLFGSHVFRCLPFRRGEDGVDDCCRMCRGCVEYPEHALIQCLANPETVRLRREFFRELAQLGVELPREPTDNREALGLLRRAIFHWDAVEPAACFVHGICKIWGMDAVGGDEVAPDGESDSGSDGGSRVSSPEVDVEFV